MIIKCLNLKDMDTDRYQLFLSVVSEMRRRNAGKYYRKEDAYRCVCAEVLLQACIFETTGKLENFDLTLNSFGKPYVLGMRHFFFNLSHAGEWVVIAYGGRELGIDVEKVRDNMDGIVDSCYGKKEKEYVSFGDFETRNERATEIWTMKESYVKYKGIGLSLEFSSFDVKEDEFLSTEGEQKSKFFIKTWKLAADYYVSVCCEEKIIRIDKLSIDDMSDFVLKQQNNVALKKRKHIIH